MERRDRYSWWMVGFAAASALLVTAGNALGEVDARYYALPILALALARLVHRAEQKAALADLRETFA